MKKIRTWVIVFAIVVIIAQLVIIDYSDLRWSVNGGSYLGILSMLLVILSMVLSKGENEPE